MTRIFDSLPMRGTVVWTHSQAVDIVFGLDWTPLVGGVPAKLGKNRARALRATHFLVTGSLSAVVGCGIIQKKSGSIPHTDRSKPLHSVAAIFALTHQEGVIAAISFMPNKGYWLVAANAGLVLAQTDCWYSSALELEAALDILVARFPTLQIVRAADLTEDSLPDWLKSGLNVHSRLQKLSTVKYWRVQMLCLTALLGGFYWIVGVNTPRPSQNYPVENFEALWQLEYDNFAKLHPVHHPEQLFSVLHAWNQAPLTPNGWKLKQIVCEPMQMDWHCAARYQRAQRVALSEHLDLAKPEGWTAEFTDLEHGVLRWQVEDAASPFQAVSLSTPLKMWLSYLQSVAPVFDSIQIGTGSRVSITVPTNAHGLPMLRPSRFKPLTRRHISIKGPLRSMSALKGLPIPVRWRGLQLEIGQAVGQGINRSELTVSLTGEVFETNE